MAALRAAASKPLLTALAFGLVALLGWIDYLSGLEYSVAILYLIPVFITAWFVGRRVAVTTAFAGAAAWLLASAALFQQEEIPAALFWNDLVQLGFFLVVAYTLSALRSALEHEKATARTDDLTGVPNRRHFYDLAEREIERQRRYGGTFSIAYIDIDNFKDVNDTFGHSAGDALLRLAAQVMRETIRAADTVARIGGDEFAILLPETDKEAALTALAKIRDELARRAGAERWLVSLSIGMITYGVPPESVDRMFERVDALLYNSKHGGKDRISHETVERPQAQVRSV